MLSVFLTLSLTTLAPPVGGDFLGSGSRDSIYIEAWRPSSQGGAPPSTGDGAVSEATQGTGSGSDRPAGGPQLIESGWISFASIGPSVIGDGYCIYDSGPELCTTPTEDTERDTPEEADPIGLIQSQVEREVARLPVPPARIHWQPDFDQVLVNIDTVFYTEAGVEYLGASILGYPVTIEVTPRTFEWDYGDGSEVFRTTDQGAMYPNHTISHKYASAGNYSVSLTTTWDARFRVEGRTGWIPVSGTPVTIDHAGPITAVTRSSHLVLDG